MDTLAVPLTDAMREFLQKEATKQGFSTPVEFVQSLLRQMQERDEDRMSLDNKLRDGLGSPPMDGDDAFWRELEQEFLDRHPELRT